MSICEQCGAEYKAKRATSRYCGDKCRVTASRLSVTKPVEVSVTELSVTGPDVTLSNHRKCGPIPGDPDYDGVALQEKFRKSWAHPDGVDFRPDDPDPELVQAQSLPDYVPAIIQAKYARAGDEYRQTIHRLITTDVADLLAEAVA